MLDTPLTLALKMSLAASKPRVSRQFLKGDLFHAHWLDPKRLREKHRLDVFHQARIQPIDQVQLIHVNESTEKAFETKDSLGKYRANPSHLHHSSPFSCLPWPSRSLAVLGNGSDEGVCRCMGDACPFAREDQAAVQPNTRGPAHGPLAHLSNASQIRHPAKPWQRASRSPKDIPKSIPEDAHDLRQKKLLAAQS